MGESHSDDYLILVNFHRPIFQHHMWLQKNRPEGWKWHSREKGELFIMPVGTEELTLWISSQGWELDTVFYG